MTNPIRIHIADDHAVFRCGLRAFLENEESLTVTGESADAGEALQHIRKDPPDVLILDVHMPGLPAAELVKELSKSYPQVKVLVLTMHNEERYLREFLKLGACGFMVKTSTGGDVVQAIEQVVNGEQYVDPRLAHFLISNYIGRSVETKGGAETLTAREREVCAYLASGHTNAEVASALRISRRTVETHRAAIMAKVGLKSRAELVQFAVDAGLWAGPMGTGPAT